MFSSYKLCEKATEFKCSEHRKSVRNNGAYVRNKKIKKRGRVVGEGDRIKILSRSYGNVGEQRYGPESYDGKARGRD